MHEEPGSEHAIMNADGDENKEKDGQVAHQVLPVSGDGKHYQLARKLMDLV